ncbi:hypothetical protein C8J57DRAFT_1240641 [Mycena rebaudengoi]|nr:hypothetical protein C8J57DRAFT_1240641 [Mycena rebaudengoi]
MGWQSWAPGAKEACQMQMNKEHHEGMAAAKRREEEKEEERKERKHQQAAERQRRHRERKKADREDELSDDDNANAVLLRGADALAHQRQIDVPGTSHAGTQGWQAQRNGRNGGAMQKKAQTVNWYNPFLFGHIETAMQCTGWSPTAAVNSLLRDFPNLFKSLAKGTISKWRVKGKNEWKKETMDKVVAGRIITASGRTGILTPYPEITRNVKEILQGLRVAGAVVNVSIARGLLVAEIKEQQPHLLEKFKVSEFYVRTFLASVMDWSPWKATRQARHIPEDAPVLLERTFFRIRYAILTGGIPPELIVNADQVGNYLLPASGQTFHDRGASQAVWAGKTDGSLPKANAEKMEDAIERGFNFSSAKSKKKGIIASNPDLDNDQQMICFIDIYPVHTGEEFRTNVFDEHPYIILIFVPGGCTGLFQPADVSLQRVAKHILKQDSLNYLVDVFQSQSKAGVAPKDVKFPSSLPVLCDATVRGLVKMYDYFQTLEGHKIVQQAWRKCEVTGMEWNLSPDCLYGKASEKALREFLRQDQTLATEILNRCGATHLGRVLLASSDTSEPTEPIENPQLGEAHVVFNTPDDSDVSFNVVVQESLGISVMGIEFSQNPVTSLAAIADDHEGLVAGDECENMWAYADNGQPWDDMEEVENGA